MVNALRLQSFTVALGLVLSGCGAGAYLKVPMTDDAFARDWAAGRFTRVSTPLEDNAETTLSYVQAGDAAGRRILFIHGSPGHAGIWEPQFADIPAGRDYVAVDRPGYGFSRPRLPRPALTDQAKALAPLITQGEARKVVLVGYSMGGPVALRTAIDYPDRVAGLVLASSNIDPDLEPYRWYNELATWWIFKPFIKRRWRNSNREILRQRQELEDMVPLLDTIAVPVAVIHTRDDRLVPVENVDFMQRRMTRANFVRITLIGEGGHRTPITRPELTRQALNQVLAALDENAGDTAQ